eukprot:GILI01039200.1.p1 GENE.GILI01039200.1~~GILI01039200.1.p1  ORF type:complete len:287 (-),score=24.12 GILI01039200.1:77-937(-)
METWRPKLIASIMADNDWVQAQKQDLQKNVKDLAHKKECCNCRLLCYASDTINLLCHHAHCFDCVSDRLERLTGYLEKRNINLPILKNLMVCSRCHKPTAVSLDTVAAKRIAQQDRGGRARYTISSNASEIRSVVRSYYQNQRRSLLGKFQFKGLWPFERPRFTSCEDGSETLPVDLRELENLDACSSREGEVRDVELYLEDWSFDTVDGDPLGWHYAFNWPKHESEWTYVASATTLVRRRRMYRASILLKVGKGERIQDYIPTNTRLSSYSTSNPYYKQTSGVKM